MSALSFLLGLLNSPLSAVLSPAEWDALLPELRAEQLTPFVYARLRTSLAWKGIPPAAQHILAEDFQGHSLHTYFMQAELAAIVEALRAANVPVLLLKGAALGRLVYGSPAERPLRDLDLLIPAKDLELAGKTLTRRGYKAQDLLLLTRWQQRYRAEQRLVCTAPDREGMVVELHWSLVEAPYYIDRIPMADIWQTAVAAPDLPSAKVPDGATLLLHSCAHLALHHSQDQRLLWLLDVDRLLRWRRLDWNAVLERAARWDLQLALRTIVQQTEARLGTPLPADIAKELARLEPAPAERVMWGVGDDRPDRNSRRIRASWATMSGRQRWRYVGWLGLCKLISYPEKMIKSDGWNKSHA